MPRPLLIEYLDRGGAQYHRQNHSVAYTAQEIAALSHVRGGCFAKVVMIHVEHELSMMVLPAHYLVDCRQIENTLNAASVSLASECEFSRRFPRCEIGAMPPFGHLYGLQTYMSSTLLSSDDIAFNAGSHSEIIKMSMSEYLRLAFVSVVEQGVVSPQKSLSSKEVGDPLSQCVGA